MNKTVRLLDYMRNREIRIEIPEELELDFGKYILLKSDREQLVGKVLDIPRKLKGIQCNKDIKFQRNLSETEVSEFLESQEGSRERRIRAQELADELKLKMHFFESRVGWKKKMYSFFFTSDNPVDFRELLRVMVKEFQGRIHLDRVSMRERTRMVGGIGGCGRGADCCQFLPLKKQKVTLDSVRDQGIMINNNEKILGLHGNVKTCFLYEVDDYREKRKYLPHIRQTVKIGKQEARVTGLDILNQKVKVITDTGVFETYPVRELEFEGKREIPEEPEISFEGVKMEREGVGI